MTAPMDFLWIGNHPATDLCNTEPVVEGDVVELLPDFDSILRWVDQAGIEVRADVASIGTSEAQRTLNFVHRLRTSLREVLEQPTVPPEGLQTLNALLAGQRGAYAITDDLTPSLVGGSPAKQLRLDITTAVCEIFHHDRTRIRRCANPACVLLFLDVSKSGRRRWCDMSSCGNRAKVARHYERTR